jgi:flagellar biosynthesis/type III secretory pathway protein FliH
MSDGFAPGLRFKESDFAPTSLIAALDAARAEAARMPPPEQDPTEETLRAVAAAAREDGFAAGRASMMQETAQRAAESVAQVAKILAASRQTAADIATTASNGMAGLALAMLEAALPGLAARQGAQLIGDFAERLRPALAFLPQAEIRVNPALIEDVRALAGDLPVTLVPDPALAPGDARAVWQGGGADFDLAARRAAIMDLLRAAGLDPEAEFT